MKGTGLYLAKSGSNIKTSSFFAKETSLILSKSLTHSEGGMVSAGSESLSL